MMRAFARTLSASFFVLVHVLAQDHAAFLSPIPEVFADTNVVLLKDRLAVIPGDWHHDHIASTLQDIRASDPAVASAFSSIADASFVAWDESFLQIVGPDAKVETLQTFVSPESGHVHEAPVYFPETNELVYSDTSMVGWLWAVNIDTQKTRKIETNPPLANVNGATNHNSLLYACTNGGSVRGIFTVNLTTGATEPILNNFRGRHFNSPNDLVTDSRGNIFFTDPIYGWVQQWPGVQEPQLPSAVYHFDTKTKAVTALTASWPVQAPNGLALSLDEKTLYVADSNSSFQSQTSVRSVWAFDVEAAGSMVSRPRLVYQAESGWPDGIRVSRTGLLFVAVAGGADVVDPQSGLLLGKINTPGDIVFNLEPATGERDGVWLLTGNKAIYKVTIAEGARRPGVMAATREQIGGMAQEYLGSAMGAMQDAYERVMS